MATILLLDDDPGFRDSAASVLQSLGHEVLQCARASDTRRLLAGRQVDLLLVDFLLPDSDGVRFVEELRSAGVKTPAVLVSHFWKRSDTEVLRQGFVDVLHKPVAPAVLAAKVRRLVGGPARPLDAQCERALDELRVTYSRELPTLLEGLREALRELRREPGEMAVRGVVRRRAHHIAGTAGSFGFRSVGEACAQIEQALFTHAGIAWERIESALQLLSGAAQAPELTAAPM